MTIQSAQTNYHGQKGWNDLTPEAIQHMKAAKPAGKSRARRVATPIAGLDLPPNLTPPPTATSKLPPTAKPAAPPAPPSTASNAAPLTAPPPATTAATSAPPAAAPPMAPPKASPNAPPKSSSAGL